MLNYLWAGMLALGILWAAFHGNMEAVTNGVLDSAREAVSLCVTMLGIMSFWCGILKVGEKAGLIRQLSEKMKPVIRFLFPSLPDNHPAAAYISTNMIANMLGLGWAATPAGLRAMEELEHLEEERRGEAGDEGPERERDSAWEEKLSSGQPVKSGGNREGKQDNIWEETPGDGQIGRAGRIREGRSGSIRRGKSKNGLNGKNRLARPRGTAGNEMCTFLIVNISSLQLIPINMIAYRSQYGSVNPAAVAGPALLATLVSTGVGVLFCKLMDRG